MLLVQDILPREILRTWIGHCRQSQNTGKPVRFEYLDKRGEHEVWLSAMVSYLGTTPYTSTTPNTGSSTARVAGNAGSILYALGSAVLLVNEQTGEPYIQGASIAITERKQAEQAPRELNATLESKVAQRTAELEHRARQLEKLTLQLSQAEEQERRRIAVILYEDLQQQTAGAKFHLNLVRNRAADERLRTDADKVDRMLKDAIEKFRSLAHDLSPAVMHMNDLDEILHWLVSRVWVPQGLSVELDISGDNDAALGSAGGVPVSGHPGDAVQCRQARAGP